MFVRFDRAEDQWPALTAVEETPLLRHQLRCNYRRLRQRGLDPFYARLAIHDLVSLGWHAARFQQNRQEEA